MNFNSLSFIIFFPIVTSFFFVIPHKYRWALLLCASYIFYMCSKPIYIILLLISTLISYYTAIKIEESENKAKDFFFALSLVSNLGILFVFKYFNFFMTNIKSTAEYIGFSPPRLELILPVGISFYTFQVLSYSFDVYRGNKSPERHLGIFALYVSFFPQLVAGPIERSTHLLPQFHKKSNFDYKRITHGLQLMLWGFLQKMVIADRLAIFVNNVYNNPTEHYGLQVILATYFFAFQIYCDFSGYSDIAIGAAQVLGYEIMDNFRQPYFSHSIIEFWTRWHISLYSWFKDYLYIPLGGNKVSKSRWYGNIFIVFLVSGLWHGAGWTFVLWGALHGLFIILSIRTKKLRAAFSSSIHLNKLPFLKKTIGILSTFHLNMFKISTHNKINLFNLLNRFELNIAFVSILIMLGVHLLQSRIKIREYLSKKPLFFRWTAYYGVTLTIFFFGVFKHSEFIYFQF